MPHWVLPINRRISFVPVLTGRAMPNALTKPYLIKSLVALNAVKSMVISMCPTKATLSVQGLADMVGNVELTAK